jgi:two-component system response regulator YesN
MSGLELIEQIWEHVSRKIGFIILSGFYEFEYARKAIKYSVNDYVLKPVQKDELIRALENFKDQHFKKIAEQKKLEDTDSLLFDRHLTNLIADRYDAEDLEYVKNCLVDASNIRFISIEYDPSDESFHEQPTEEKVKARNVLYDALKIYLGEQCCHSYMETNPNNSTYGVGFLLTKRLEEQSGLNEKEYIKKLYQRLSDMVNKKLFCLSDRGSRTSAGYPIPINQRQLREPFSCFLPRRILLTMMRLKANPEPVNLM